MTIYGRRIALIVLAALAVGGCSSSSTPSVVSSAGPSPGTTADGGAGTSPGSPGASLDPNAPAISTDPGDRRVIDPTGGRITIPKPGQLDVRPIPAQTLTAAVTGRSVVVSIAYTSGVEPCHVLDSITVKTGPQSFEITLREGHGPGDVACIEIAQSKRAVVNLGELEPGTYRITDGAGGAAPISVTVA